MLNTVERVLITPPDAKDELGAVESTAPERVAEIVATVRRARSQWSELPVSQRAVLLRRAASSLDPRREELALLLAAESGKPIGQARAEVRSAIALLHANAEVASRLQGRVLATEGNPGTERDLAYTRREPLGVVAAVLPFNFPVELYVEKCAAALAGGNAVVVKAPPEDPLTVVEVHEALLAAGVPEEVLKLIHGGAAVGAALAEADGVDAISLTGSTAAGVSVARVAAPTLRRLHLELGGNNAALVLADADLDLVVAELVPGRLLMNGQACAASKRIVVDRSLHDELAQRLAAAIRAQRVGPALDQQTTVGPLITASAAARVQRQVSAAIQQGARLLEGEGRARGPYFSPCLLVDVPQDADIAVDEEIFGPVFALIPVSDAGEALAVANGSAYGLMASVFSADLGLAVSVAERLETGGVVVNGSDNYRPPVIPFGGTKLSGTGREGAGYTLAELTREKTIVLRRFRAPLEERLEVRESGRGGGLSVRSRSDERGPAVRAVGTGGHAGGPPGSPSEQHGPEVAES